MSIFLECSKTDVYRDGSWILVARTGSKLCPVKNFEEYMGLANIQVNYHSFQLAYRLFHRGVILICQLDVVQIYQVGRYETEMLKYILNLQLK